MNTEEAAEFAKKVINNNLESVNDIDEHFEQIIYRKNYCSNLFVVTRCITKVQKPQQVLLFYSTSLLLYDAVLHNNLQMF